MSFSDFMAIYLVLLGALTAVFVRYAARAYPIYLSAVIILALSTACAGLWNAALDTAVQSTTRAAIGSKGISVEQLEAIRGSIREAQFSWLVPLSLLLGTVYLTALPWIMRHLNPEKHR